MNTKQGSSAGFVDATNRDLTPSFSSALRNAGTVTSVSVQSCSFRSLLGAALYEPPPHGAPAVDVPVPRVNLGVLDIGAFEAKP